MYVNEARRKLFGNWINGKRNVWLSESDIRDLENNNNEMYEKIVMFNWEEFEKKFNYESDCDKR